MTLKRIIRIFLLVAVLGLLPRWVGAQSAGARENILIISSYNPDTRRMSSFISDFEVQLARLDVPCDISIETLECKNVSDAPKWIGDIDRMLTRYEGRNLRAVVLLGQEAWASFVSLGRFPEGVMVFSSFASQNGVMLPAPEQTEEWMPEAVDYTLMEESLPSAGGLLNYYNISGNIELIRSLYPEVEQVAFISDNTYGGISLQALVRKVMAEKYPELELVLVDSRQGEAAAREAYASLSPRAVALLGTWRADRDGAYLMLHSLKSLVQGNPLVPVFTVTGTGLGDVAVGGCVPDYESGAKVVAEQISEYYGTHNPSAAHFLRAQNKYLFDASKLKELKIAQYALPKGSVIEDAVEARLSKYSHYVKLLAIGIMLLIVMLAFVVALLLRMRRLTVTLREREGQLVVAREKAEESDMLKSAFLANMSHEIRTPLNAIVGFSSLMQSEELSQEERAEYCSIVVSNSEMLLTLLNDILDISSLECGKIRFSYSSEDIVQICQHVILTTAHTRQEGVEMRFECSVESFMIVTDAHRLSQILINLLTNAGKFTSKGSITLSLDVDEQRGEVAFAVADTGPGIPLAKQETVFTRFEKLSGNMKKGTGLGLAICRQIAAIVGGRIYVDPSYTKGAKFVFVHPVNIRLQEDGENREGGGGFRPSEPRNTLRVDKAGRLVRDAK